MERKYKVIGVFSGAGGLDLGFEQAGFEHVECVEIDQSSVLTLRKNRPYWSVWKGDIAHYSNTTCNPDVLIGGPPCQGFSLGGKRNAKDERNVLFMEMVRLTEQMHPRVVVIENVLNLRTMIDPQSGKPFINRIASSFESLGYTVYYDIFKMAEFSVPQTRRRFIFVAISGRVPKGYHLPHPKEPAQSAKDALWDLAHDDSIELPNHDVEWNFISRVHTNRRIKTSSFEPTVPVRISRTGSDGHPIRDFDRAFPAVDTGTIWGWARGTVDAERVDRQDKDENKVFLWRITADNMRRFTPREYARLQTIPDEWVFFGKNQRDIHKQIGNAVPVAFAKIIGENINMLLRCQDRDVAFQEAGGLGVQAQFCFS